MWRNDLLEKTLKLGKIEGRRRGLYGHGFEQAPGVGDGQGSLACCSPWGCKESDMTEGMNWLKLWNTTFYFSMNQSLCDNKILCNKTSRENKKHKQT